MNAKELVEFAVRKAKKESRKIGKSRTSFERFKKSRILLVKFTQKELDKKLRGIEHSFPSLDSMEKFYQDLIEAVFGAKKLKQRIGHLKALRKVIKKIAWEHISEIKKSDSESRIRGIESRFLGRIYSLAKDLGGTLEELKTASRELKRFPRIEFDARTVLLAGFPNTGKTTVLRRLTGSRARIAAYAFTTKDLMVGFFEKGFERIQVIDTPGLLDKEESKRNPTEKKAVSALKNLDGTIFFIVDPTQFCGFGLKKQFALFKELKRKGFRVEVILNKGDLASKKEIDEAQKLFGKKAFVAGEGKEKELKEFVERKLSP